ncbi:GspH/FimT family pseudopilin [Congregibacter variabilis]|uniref:GspH/FimT family pseudopilin n=1 Tax=Congregibacter variabilis TaxID=3081200 RepID=UPI003890D6A8
MRCIEGATGGSIWHQISDATEDARDLAAPRLKQGFTLLQILIGISVASIMISLAMPPYAFVMAESESKAALSRARSLFALARQTALLMGEPVTICAIDQQNLCSNDWTAQHSLVVFVDADADQVLDQNEEALRNFGGINSQGILKWRASLGRRHLTFEPSGGTWQNGTLIYCPKNQDSRHARALIISHTGRSYVTRDTDGDGIREDRRGHNIDCTL